MSRVPCRSARRQVCWGVAVSGVLPQVGENRCKVMEKVGFDKIFVCNEEKWQKNAVYLSSVTSCFFHRHFALFLDYNPVGLHAYVGVLQTVNHWFLSLQYAFARVRRFHALSISPETMSGVPIRILSQLTALSCSCMILLSRGGKCCNIQLVGESKAVGKVFTKVSQVSHCPTVPNGIMYFV